jgi:gliding motility-associated-like protein
MYLPNLHKINKQYALLKLGLVLFFHKHMKPYLLFILFNFFCANAFCQMQNNIWYFGEKAGLDLSTNPPTPLLDGALVNEEAVASISDLNGNLLFYTNGQKVWNSEHQIMENGEGLFGSTSSSQLLIVPKPGNCNQFYIFTTPSQNDEVALSFTIVDMLENNGFGKVISKNNSLKLPSTERITATLKSNGNDYWIIAQEFGSNAFLSYSLTASGLNNVPVVSNVGEPSISFSDVIRSLKVSSNGKKIVCVSEIGHTKCQLFDFDNVSGIVSNPITLSTEGAYGSEFSPDNNIVYIAKYGAFKLMQFDISSGIASTIQNSMIVLANNNSERGGSIQLASDNKIYIARAGKTFLDIVNNPNQTGIGCQYLQNGISLAGKKSNVGLPNNVKSFSQSTCGKLSAKSFKVGCNNFKIIATSSHGLAPYTFSLDGIFFQQSNTFLNLLSGPYMVYAKDALGVVKNISITINPIGNPVLSILSTLQPNCGKKDGATIVTTTSGKAPYTYSIDGINFQIDSTFLNLGTEPNNFYVKDAEGCIDNKTNTLQNLNNDKVFAGNDTIIFIYQTVPLFAKDITSTGFNSYVWSPSNGLSNPNFQNPIATIDRDIEYTVKASNTNNGCKAEDKILIRVAKEADIYVPSAFTPNGDRLNDILKAKPIGITTFKYFYLYNRYGQMVFSTTNAAVGWDGKLNTVSQNSGAYVYVTEGINYTGRTIKKQGFVMLLR